MKKLASINKFLVQCHRCAPSLTAIQVAIILVMYEHDEIICKKDICDELDISRSLANRQMRYLLDLTGRELIVMKGFDHLYLTEHGERYCRRLLVNAKHFFKPLS